MINIELLAHEAVLKGYDKDPVAAQEERAILRDALLTDARKGATLPNDIPEPEVRAYFEAHKADYRDPERRRLSFIILKDEATANAVLEQAKKSATASQWGELVRAKSNDPALDGVACPVQRLGFNQFSNGEEHHHHRSLGPLA